MSKRKDLRNGRESGAWKPGLWSTSKVNRFTGHVLTVFLMELEREMPRQEATRIFGEFLRERDRRLSELGLRNSGVTTLAGWSRSQVM